MRRWKRYSPSRPNNRRRASPSNGAAYSLISYASIHSSRRPRSPYAATSAARDASNSEDFFGAAEAIVGTRPELLSGDEEGRLSFAGATAELSAGDGPFLVIDIGGGSTECMVGTDKPDEVRSYDIGCVRLTEKHLAADPPEPEELSNAIAEATWIKENGLRGGVLLPPVPPDVKWVKPLYDPAYDRLWKVLEDLELPVNAHGGTGVPDYGKYPTAMLLYIMEASWYSQRPFVQLTLRQLDQTQNWQQARDRLRRLHRLIHEDVALLPLYQTIDHFAYRRSLQGLAPARVTLYQDIDQWQASPQLAEARP